MIILPVFRHAAVFGLAGLMLCCTTPKASYPKGARSDDECTVSNARPTTIAEASRNRDALEDACIQVTGIIDGWTLYQGLDDIYRDTRAWQQHDPDRQLIERIGLRDFPKDLDLAPSTTGALRVTLVGRVHDCDEDPGERQKTDKDIVVLRMGVGWCHYNSGAVLTPIAIVSQDSVALTRKTGRQAWREFGDIVPSPKDSALGAEALLFLDRVIDAARRGDRRTVLDLHGYSLIVLEPDGISMAADDLDSVAGSDAQRVLDLWFGDSGSLLSAVRNGSGRPNVRLFEPRWKLNDKQELWEDGPELWACWGGQHLAEASWPISSMDAGNVPGRPYACVNLVKERHEYAPFDRVDAVWVAYTFGGPSMMKEPTN